MLKGKAKEKFEEWLLDNHTETLYSIGHFLEPTRVEYLEFFNDLPPQFQWGVIEGFADSQHKLITIKAIAEPFLKFRVYIDFMFVNECDTRQEARTAAIERLNQLINKE